MRKVVRTIDPKLEKYREHKPARAPEKYTPKNLEDFIGVMRRTPKSVLTMTERERIAAVMNFEVKRVGDLMVKKDKMVFVKGDEMLGPLTLDKLYQSGFTNFPVINRRERVVGVLHTEALNALEIRKMDTAAKYIDKEVHYLHERDTLAFSVEEIERTNAYYFLVLDEREELVGFFTIRMLLDYLLG